MTGPGIPAGLKAALSDRYRIERELGAGGMATVYLAEDLKHKRKVAVKVLRPELAAVLGADRFVQEIETTAQLQHPHILPLFDSGTADGFLFYVMPYIEGETLRDKLDRETQLGVDEAVRIAREVADALDYAHRSGVIHRDIKPENVLLHDGRPMVADFGIALAVSAAAGGRMTETGTSVGTPHYMSPEQATADKEITGRADIYSLASVLYEMLAGDPPHTGSSAQQVIMKIIADTPRPVSELRKSVPPNVAAAVMMALEKLPADRFDSAKAFADALADPAFAARGLAAGVVGADGLLAVRRWKRIAIGVAAVAVPAIGALIAIRPSVAPPPVMHVAIPTPDGVSLLVGQGINFDIAPDASAIAFVGQDSSGTQSLWLRTSDRLDAVRIEGTEDARTPRFSPDGMEVAFVAGRALSTVAVVGAPPFTVVADSVAGGGGSGGLAWGADGYLYFRRTNGGGIARVAAGGGTVERLAGGDSTRTPAWFDVLPNGRGLIYSITGGGTEQTEVAVLDLRSRQSKVLLQGTGARFAPPDELLYATAQGRVLAVGFDPDRLALLGDPRPMLEGIQVNTGSASYLASSASGALLYATGTANVSAVMTWLTRDGSGTEMPLALRQGAVIDMPSVSPNGRRIAFLYWPNRQADSGSVWVYDVAQRTAAPLTTTGNTGAPFWRPDGREVGYAVAEAGGGTTIYARPSDFSGSARVLLPATAAALAAEWTPDGSALVYSDTSGRIRYASLSAPGAITEVAGPVLTPDLEYPSMRFSVSPDGRWVAFESSLSGSAEVYVAPLPGPGGRHLVSSGGGMMPRWTRDGGSIIYQDPGFSSWIIAAVRTTPDFAVTSRRSFGGGSVGFHDAYDAAPGERLVALRRGDAGSIVNQMRLITDWRRGLARPQR